MPAELDLRVFDDVDSLSRTAAVEVARRAGNAIRARGRFTIALAGGSTPKRLYALLADGEVGDETPLDWPRVHVFFGDERHVPPDHADSNYGMARDAMLARVPIPGANIHRILAEDPEAQSAASAYERTLIRAFGLRNGEVPLFDVVLLGMGPDGHTASLFPGSEALEDRGRLVVAHRVEKLATWRITLTLRVINYAATVMFLVAGDDKAAILREALEGPSEPGRFPAQLIRPTHGALLWLVDRAAASLLTRPVGSS